MNSTEPCKNCIFNKYSWKCTTCWDKDPNCISCHFILLCNKCEIPNWSNWSSGNQVVDDFIKECNKKKEILKWIPYNQFSEITYLAKGGFGTIYKARWNCKTTGRLGFRFYDHYDVALKKLHNSRDIAKDFLNEVKNYILCAESNAIANNESIRFLTRLYGISYDSDFQEFVIVTQYAEGGDLKSNIMRPAEFTTKKFKFRDSMGENYCNSNEKIIVQIAEGLKLMHNFGFVHCDLHIGNILLSGTVRMMTVSISDFGLSRPANMSSLNKSSGIYGVIPYIAPELFDGEKYTPASDIYSLGIIIWVLHSFEQPYSDRNHDVYLITDIIRGLRPEISPEMGIPDYLIELMNKCLDSDPKNRPTAQEIIEIIRKEGGFIRSLETSRKKYALFKVMNKIDHPGTHYTSRYLSFQSVEDHLNKLTSEDSGQNDLSLPTSINKDDIIKDLEDRIIALPTLPNTSSYQIP